ncbi:MAG: DUF3667 domain-containing protein [Fimbriimonas sp.]|nr:DUF3667 domain-containing protein [Fimbriimonas sp.]
MPEAFLLCPNCGNELALKFCANCGQRQVDGLPAFGEILHEVLGAVFSYDGKLWRTLKTLAATPGQLTVEYASGRRAAFLGPWQLFIWLQAITFTVHQAFFDPDARYTHNKSLAILALGLVLSIALWAFEPKGKAALTHAVLAASHMWSFLMIVLLIEYAVAVPLGTTLIGRGLLDRSFPIGEAVTWIAIAAMEPYLLLSLKRVYRKSWPATALRWVGVNGAVLAGMIGLARYI